MAGDIRLCVVSMSARTSDGDDAAYLEWHGLDHLPEQYRIPGMQHGQRWVSSPACRVVRAAEHERYRATDHVVQYLFGEPVAESVDRFFELGAELRAAGRMPLRLPPVELGGYELEQRVAAGRALVSAEVLPWRPSRGVYLLVRRSGGDDVGDALRRIPGVAGFWRYRGGAFHERLADTTGLHLTVCYLDDDPVVTGQRVAEVVASLEPRALFAAPFESVVPWHWGRVLP